MHVLKFSRLFTNEKHEFTIETWNFTFSNTTLPLENILKPPSNDLPDQSTILQCFIVKLRSALKTVKTYHLYS